MEIRPASSRIAATLVVAAMFVACGTGSSAYFETSGSTQVAVPIKGLEPVYFGIELLTATGDDRVELVSLEADGVQGNATAEGLTSRLDGSTAWIGSGTARDVEAAGIDPSSYRPVAGTEFSAADGPIALAVRLSGDAPEFGFERVRLHFKVDGGPTQTQVFDLSGHVCSAPAYADAVRACAPSAGASP